MKKKVFEDTIDLRIELVNISDLFEDEDIDDDEFDELIDEQLNIICNQLKRGEKVIINSVQYLVKNL